MLRVGIFNHYLDSFGGGEKDVCAMAEALSGKYRVELLSYKDVKKTDLENRLNVNLSDVEVRTVLPFTGYGPLSRTLRFMAGRLYRRRLTEPYDLFIDLVNYVPPPSYAKKSVLRIQFPCDTASGPGLFKSYRHFLANSEYTRRWTKNKWGLDAEVLYPPVASFPQSRKEPIILSVGRLFVGGHNKKHLEMMSAVKKLLDGGLRGWEYHIIGSRLPGRENEEYLRRVIDAASGYPIFIHADAPFSLLKDYYARASLFIHATGFGEDENAHPEKLEHFGITTVEAMSAGCVPVVIDKGGQPEIVSHGENGFLWRTEEELIRFCKDAVNDHLAYERLSSAAVKRSAEFSIDIYRDKVLDMAARVILTA